ncbi:uncharacterized protein PHA67_006662 [Liasis olivaceus]
MLRRRGDSCCRRSRSSGAPSPAFGGGGFPFSRADAQRSLARPLTFFSSALGRLQGRAASGNSSSSGSSCETSAALPGKPERRRAPGEEKEEETGGGEGGTQRAALGGADGRCPPSPQGRLLPGSPRESRSPRARERRGGRGCLPSLEWRRATRRQPLARLGGSQSPRLDAARTPESVLTPDDRAVFLARFSEAACPCLLPGAERERLAQGHPASCLRPTNSTMPLGSLQIRN